MLSYFSIDFLYDLSPHLFHTYLPSILMQCIINAPCSYFRLMDNFTGLIEFLVGIIWSLYYTWQKQNQTLQIRQILVTSYVILWSTRLGCFLLYRMFRLGPTDTRIIQIWKKHGQGGLFVFWLVAHGSWSVISCLPVTLLHAFPMPDNGLNIIDLIGSMVWICGFVMESIADWTKLNAKLSGKKMYYRPGFLWEYSRNPNHCGEIFCWLGLAMISYNLFFYHGNISMVILLLLSPSFALVAMVFEATLASELNNNKRFNNQSDYYQYRTQTSLLWPISPRIYLHLPQWIKQKLFFQWNMYNKGLKQSVS